MFDILQTIFDLVPVLHLQRKTMSVINFSKKKQNKHWTYVCLGHGFICVLYRMFLIHVLSPSRQLSESEESEDEALNKAASDKKAAPSGGKKYVPPRIAPMHYGNDSSCIKYRCCIFWSVSRKTTDGYSLISHVRGGSIGLLWMSLSVITLNLVENLDLEGSQHCITQQWELPCCDQYISLMSNSFILFMSFIPYSSWLWWCW